MSLQSLLGGFEFVWRDRVILGTISLDMCAVFLAGVPDAVSGVRARHP